MRVITDYPIAFDSPDHTNPHGTMRDNSTSIELLDELQFRLRYPYSLLDLGCAGGQFVVDCLQRDNLAIGLDGSNYSVVQGRANWPEYYNKNLFTCDISRPFEIQHEYCKQPFRFDVITAWEVLEHIHPDRLSVVVENLVNHLSPLGIVFASIATESYVAEDVEYHLSGGVAWEDWLGLLGRTFQVMPYPYLWSPREDRRNQSHFIQMRLLAQ